MCGEKKRAGAEPHSAYQNEEVVSPIETAARKLMIIVAAVASLLPTCLTCAPSVLLFGSFVDDFSSLIRRA